MIKNQPEHPDRREFLNQLAKVGVASLIVNSFNEFTFSAESKNAADR